MKTLSMLSTIHLGELMHSGKRNRATKEVIYKPDVIVDYNKTVGGVDLLSQVLIPYFTQRRGVKRYRKIGQLMLDISVYNSFIAYQKLNPENGIKDHLRYRMELMEEILTHHLFGVALYQAGTTPSNMLRLNERHFISQVPSTPGKPHAQRRCIRCAKLETRRNTRFWCRRCGVGLCLSNCFEVYHTLKDFARELEDDGDD